MMIDPAEWKLLGAELVERGILQPIDDGDLIHHNGSTLLNGIFGVSKSKKVLVDGV